MLVDSQKSELKKKTSATLQPQVKLAVIGDVTDFGASDRMHAAPTAGMASWSRKVHEWHFASAVHLAQQVSLLFAFDTLYIQVQCTHASTLYGCATSTALYAVQATAVTTYRNMLTFGL